jgi:hypothetical protein
MRVGVQGSAPLGARLEGEVSRVAEKKITPKAAVSKSAPKTAEAATRVTKRKTKRKTRKKIK